MYSLERLDKITGQKPETTHEENFQKYFGGTIQKAIETLKMPVDASNPQKNWEPLKQVTENFWYTFFEWPFDYITIFSKEDRMALMFSAHNFIAEVSWRFYCFA